jgi:hypothetical protein
MNMEQSDKLSRIVEARMKLKNRFEEVKNQLAISKSTYCPLSIANCLLIHTPTHNHP